jgi:hypothetical protein
VQTAAEVTLADSVAAPSPVSAIPKPVRALVGREAEIAAVLEPLDARGALVTLVGTAGVGKTRIAVEVGAHWPDVGRCCSCWTTSSSSDAPRPR